MGGGCSPLSGPEALGTAQFTSAASGHLSSCVEGTASATLSPSWTASMIEAARAIIPARALLWGVSLPPPEAGGLTAITGPDDPFDWTLYARRDRELAYRDVI